MNKLLINVVTFAISISFVTAQPWPNKSLTQLPSQAAAIKGVLLRCREKIFDTLDKLAHSNWRAVQRPELAQRDRLVIRRRQRFSAASLLPKDSVPAKRKIQPKSKGLAAL